MYSFKWIPEENNRPDDDDGVKVGYYGCLVEGEGVFSQQYNYFIFSTILFSYSIVKYLISMFLLAFYDKMAINSSY